MTNRDGKRPASSGRANALSLAYVLALMALHWVLLRLGVPIGARIVVGLIIIILLMTSTVRYVRVLLERSQEEVERNPKPGDASTQRLLTHHHALRLTGEAY